jgi:hypothetical protein
VELYKADSGLFALGITLLKAQHFGDIEVLMQFPKLTFLVLEKASPSVWTETFLVELFASLCFEPFILWLFRYKLVVAMCKLAFVCISAYSKLNPVLAHLSLVFCLVNFEKSSLLLQFLFILVLLFQSIDHLYLSRW